MISLESIAADVHQLAGRLEGLADRFDAHADMLARIDERQAARMELEAAFRTAMSPLPERIARVEAQVEANARAVEALDGRGWDRWITAMRGLLDALIGPDGFLRSRPGIAIVALMAVGFGVLTVDQIVSAYTGLWPVLVPVAAPP
jgi:hypothetical protein